MAETETKRVRMNTSLAGPTVAYDPGVEYDLPAPLAEAFCADGRAEPVDAPAPRKTGGKRKAGERTGAGPAGGAETR